MIMRGVLKLYEYFPYPLLKDVALDFRLTPPDTKDVLVCYLFCFVFCFVLFYFIILFLELLHVIVLADSN